MIESLKELNQICQKPRYREVGNWMVRKILRPAALPITWLLLHTPITANQVTLISLVAALIGIFFTSLPSGTPFLIGIVLLQLWYLLDHVDGQIARYRKAASLTGRFFDFFTHHVIHGPLFFGLGTYCFFVTWHPLFLVWGFLTAMCMTLFNLIHDIKYKTFFEKLLTVETIQINSPQVFHKEKKSNQNLLKRSFSFLHKICEMHVLMNLLTLAAILEVFFGIPLDTRFILFCLYGLAVPLLMNIKIAFLIFTRSIDEDFATRFRVLKEKDAL